MKRGHFPPLAVKKRKSLKDIPLLLEEEYVGVLFASLRMSLRIATFLPKKKKKEERRGWSRF